MTDIGAVIVAAGRGERAGQADGPKQYREIGGRAVILRTLDAFLDHPRVGRVAVVIHPDDEDLALGLLGKVRDRVLLAHGGPTRQESVRLGLIALREPMPDVVLIHDAARPFVDRELIDRVIDAIDDRHGGVPVLPMSDTLKTVSPSGLIANTLDRRQIHAAQTPQGFVYKAILKAHEDAFAAGRNESTDDAAIAEAAGIPIRVVPGSSANVKLTWRRDFELAERQVAAERAFFPDVRVGNGYDVHAFEPGERVMLCGVAIPHDAQLAGHSDADVALHALTDALLATCGAGDIGTHFPPSDPQWRGAASRIFVERAVEIVRAHRGRVANADVTLICEEPRIGPHRASMVEAVADMLRVEKSRVSVKATTNERLGFIGRGEGIAAIATASVVFPGELPE